MLPLDYQSYIPTQNVSGTTDARAENNARPAIEPAQASSNAKQLSQQQQQGNTKDKVSLSKEAKDKASVQEQSELTEEEQKEVQTLKDRDQEVKIHEQAHAAVGGQYAGSPSYEYETGPDGKRYAIAGEVSIDVGEEQAPEDTVQKMQIVRAAALAPAEPSTQDLKVAAEASQKELQARAEMSEQSLDSKSDDESSKLNDSEQSQKASSVSQLKAYQQASMYIEASSFAVHA